MKSNLRLSDIATYVTDKISSSDILLEEHVTTYCVLQNKRGREIATNLSPAEWLQISGVEIRLRNNGRELNIPKVHPHKFRRTLATMAIDKGMPIEQVQHLWGHQSLDTTLQYAMVNQNNVKLSHREFLG